MFCVPPRVTLRIVAARNAFLAFCCLSFRKIAFLFLPGLLCFSFPASSFDEAVLAIDDIVMPAATFKRISVKVATNGIAEIRIGELAAFGKTIESLAIHCLDLNFSAGAIRCSKGKLRTGSIDIDLRFVYDTSKKRFDLSLALSPQEVWRIAGRFDNKGWQAEFNVVDGQLTRFAPLIPKTQPRPSAGSVTARFNIESRDGHIVHIAGDARLLGLAFTNEAGTQAAEKVDGSITLTGDRVGAALNWRASAALAQGEVYWAPLYFPAIGNRVDAQGTLDDDRLRIDAGTLKLSDVGEGRFSLAWHLRNGIESFTADATGVDGGGFYNRLLKPFLEKTAFNQLTVSGKLNAGFTYADHSARRFDMRLNDLTVTDARNRFTLQKLNADIPWRLDQATTADIRGGGASLWGIPLGAFAVPVKMHGFDFSVDDATIPMLDGTMLLKDLHALRKGENWRWQFSGVLLPVSMQATTKALGLPIMGGMLSATIPKVAYESGIVNIDGGIGIRVFDGDVAITQLKLDEPFGHIPRLSADVEMRNLDLGLVTRTFKFGSMEGKIDVDVKNLELTNWKPTTFDARVRSSPGRYPKKISQQAVQNISALGGEGAAVAIQRSFLRFFEQFGYEKIGFSCQLRDTVCRMDGVEPAPPGYVIVKGGGIPAITVKGYNRYIVWEELLGRLSRITQGNVKPIIE